MNYDWTINTRLFCTPGDEGSMKECAFSGITLRLFPRCINSDISFRMQICQAIELFFEKSHYSSPSVDIEYNFAKDKSYFKMNRD